MLFPADVALPECGAMSQGYIGYHLQNGITNELNVRGIDQAGGRGANQSSGECQRSGISESHQANRRFLYPGRGGKIVRIGPYHLWRIQAVDTDGWWRHRFLWKSRRCRLSAGDGQRVYYHCRGGRQESQLPRNTACGGQLLCDKVLQRRSWQKTYRRIFFCF